MGERRQQMGEILKPGLLAAAAHHFGLAFTPSTLVRAMANAGRSIRNQADNEATALDLCGMTCGRVQK